MIYNIQPSLSPESDCFIAPIAQQEKAQSSLDSLIQVVTKEILFNLATIAATVLIGAIALIAINITPITVISLSVIAISGLGISSLIFRNKNCVSDAHQVASNYDSHTNNNVVKGFASEASNRCFLNTCFQFILSCEPLINIFDPNINIIDSTTPLYEERIEVQNIMKKLIGDIKKGRGRLNHLSSKQIQRLYLLLARIMKSTNPILPFIDGKQRDADELLRTLFSAVCYSEPSFSYTEHKKLMVDKSFNPSMGLKLDLEKEFSARKIMEVSLYDFNPQTESYELASPAQIHKAAETYTAEVNTTESFSSYFSQLSTPMHVISDAIICYKGDLYLHRDLPVSVTYISNDNPSQEEKFLIFRGYDLINGAPLEFVKPPIISLNKRLYRLRSSMRHLGADNAGHYIAGVIQDEIPYMCNDSQINKIEIDSDTFNKAYVWIYEHIESKTTIN